MAESDGHDFPGFVDEAVPGLATGFDDVVVVFENPIREPVLAKVLPNVLDRIEFRGAGGQEDRDDVFGHLQFARGVPSGTVHEQNGVCTRCDGAADFRKMLLHGMGVGVGHHQAGTDAAGWTNGAEQVGVLVAQVFQLAWPRPLPRPLVNETVLLADPGLVLKPDLDRGRRWKVAYGRRQCPGEVFLKSSMVSGFCRG